MKTQNTINAVPDGRVIALKNELDALAYIDRFGWLRSRDLASLIWHGSKNMESAMAMAQRTLKRIKEAGEILHRIAPDGATVYALTEAGARRLGEERGIAARSGKDLIRELGNYAHRCHANTFAIHRIVAGQQVWTEREIQANRAPLKVVTHKVPDGLVDITGPLHATDITVLAWVEIESGFKKKSDFEKMLRFAFAILGRLDSQGMPSNEPFCAALDVYVEEVIIQVVSDAQAKRIVGAVAHAKTVSPYDFDWANILSRLFLCGLTGNIFPISTWVS
jgi:hypothetical protein